ncbi:hypothetical protein L6164_021933 [Bauhinia variegata]|uniref:Uncharacterized protein n=1 Tax=Bauhinia variegata TaxID=167791 RepID=A0ACB9MDH0_BAUVA|nr:hypothetical protein L6164_021933 [Bauhinia variegata]
MQTPKSRGSSSSEVPQKVSPRAVRQLRPAALETNSASSITQASKTSKERSPKINERRSPRSPVPERKRPSRISELESQISQLQEDLKNLREQLILSESCKKKAQQDAEESREQLLALSAKLEDSQKQLAELSASEEARVIELQQISEERDKAWQSELESAQKQHLMDAASLASAMNEVQQLEIQLELVTNSENAQTQHAETTDVEQKNLKQNLAEALSLVENMKGQLKDCKESEAQARALVVETFLQPEAAERTVEFLRADAAKAIEGYNSIALELEQSRARVSSLESLVSKLNRDFMSECCHAGNVANGYNLAYEPEKLEEGEEPNQIKTQLCSLKSEVRQLRSALETAESKYQEEQIRSTVQIRNAYEMVEQVKSESSQRESELVAELKKTKSDIEEFKANLMDKETELQGIVEENEGLNLKLEKSMSSQREDNLKRLDERVAELKADLMDKETTLQSISEENEMLKSEINKRLSDGGKVRGEVAAEVEAAKAAEREALMKLGSVMEEADRSKVKATRVAEQLEAAQKANSEMETELRRLKVQSDQWRKAAEAAAAMLSAGNNGKLTERSVSLDSHYNHMERCSPYPEDIDDDFHRKKNGNMLKKIGVLWKKPQKIGFTIVFSLAALALSSTFSFSVRNTEAREQLVNRTVIMGKTRGMGAARKLKSHRRRQRWADKSYKKSHLGNEWKKPFAVPLMLKNAWMTAFYSGIEAKQPNSAIRKCARVQLIKNGKKIAAFVPNDGCLNSIEENDEVLIAGFGRKGHAVGDIPGVRFKVVKVSGVSLLALFKEKKEKPRS